MFNLKKASTKYILFNEMYGVLLNEGVARRGPLVYDEIEVLSDMENTKGLAETDVKKVPRESYQVIDMSEVPEGHLKILQGQASYFNE